MDLNDGANQPLEMSRIGEVIAIIMLLLLKDEFLMMRLVSKYIAAVRY